MKKTILFLTCWLFAQINFAQDFEWAKSMGGTTDDIGNSITADANGNVYTIGQFTGTVDFDPGAGTSSFTSVGNNDIFIQKLDANGNFLWAKQIGGSANDIAKSITTDVNGNVYGTGYFDGIVDFDPGLGAANLTGASIDIFILKLDANGNFLWAKQMGGPNYDYGNGIATDANGNVYTTGSFSGPADFDPGPGVVNLTTAPGLPDIYIQKLDANGNFLWVKQFEGSSFDAGKSIHLDVSGNICATGTFQGTVDFDPGPGTANLASGAADDAFILKLDVNGDFLWAKQIAGSGESKGNSVTTDVVGNVYIAGDFGGTCDFNPGSGTFNLSSPGSSWDIFILKLNANGDFQWAKRMGGLAEDRGYGITTDASNNVYTTGFFKGTVDFDPGPGTLNLTVSGISEIFIQKLDGNGDLLWVEQFGGAVYNNKGTAITAEGNGVVHTTGFFTGTSDFDPGAGNMDLTANGSADIFVQKLACSSTGSTESVTACGEFTWIDGNTYTTSNSTATHILPNMQGCDSILTLDLTINPLPTNTITQNGATFTADQNGATYQWIDCANSNSPIAGETSQSFTPLMNGDYAVIIDNGSCSDTSACITIGDVGLVTDSPITLEIYPNPATNNLKIQSETALQEIAIYDMNGRLVLSQYLTSKINISNLENGLYMVQVTSIYGQKTQQKLIKK